MLGLRQHVGGEVARVAVGGDDQDLGGTGDEVDADFAGEQFLGGGDIDVAGPDDAVGARHGSRAEREGRDGLRAAHLEDVAARRAIARCRRPRRRASGEATQMFGTPATCAGTTVIIRWRAADSGPTGMYAATVSSGRTIWPSRSPARICAVHSRGICSSA